MPWAHTLVAVATYHVRRLPISSIFRETATTHSFTLSLHDALPIYGQNQREYRTAGGGPATHSGDDDGIRLGGRLAPLSGDRKSTRLNSSHVAISYAVFCLKKKKPAMLATLTARVASHPLISDARQS